MKKLTTKEVIDFANSNRNLILIKPDKEIIEPINGISYDDSIYIFHSTSYLSGKAAGIDASKPNMEVFEENGIINFRVNGEFWKLKESEFFDYYNEMSEDAFCGYELEDHQIDACVNRAAELEIFINECLNFSHNSRFKAYVRFRADVYNHSRFEAIFSEFYDCNKYKYFFEVLAGVDRNDIYKLPLGVSNEYVFDEIPKAEIQIKIEAKKAVYEIKSQKWRRATSR